MAKRILNIQTLGNLQISDGNHSYPTSKRRRAQVELLIIYLIMNRQRHISSSQIIDFLWPNGNSDKPAGALRNLIYRARQELQDFFSDDSCIQSKGHTYFWNPKIQCCVDFEEVMNLANQVIYEKNHSQQLKQCMHMIDLFHATFLPELQYNTWVMAENQRLEATCLDAILKTLEYLVQIENYEDILKITNHPHSQCIIDSRLYEVKLFAYYKTGQIDAGLIFYRQIVDHYYSQYGIEVTPCLKDIYQKILDTEAATQIDVDYLEKNLMRSEDKDNTFYCDFDIFKNIYQLNLRTVKRSMKTKVLVLLTLYDDSQQLTEKEMQAEAQTLKQIIASALRKNDVFSKFNMTQYSLIISSSHLQGAEIAVDRIVERYEERKKHSTVHILRELKQII